MILYSMKTIKKVDKDAKLAVAVATQYKDVILQAIATVNENAELDYVDNVYNTIHMLALRQTILGSTETNTNILNYVCLNCSFTCNNKELAYTKKIIKAAITHTLNTQIKLDLSSYQEIDIDC